MAPGVALAFPSQRIPGGFVRLTRLGAAGGRRHHLLGGRRHPLCGAPVWFWRRVQLRGAEDAVVATDPADDRSMGELALAGHVSATLRPRIHLDPLRPAGVKMRDQRVVLVVSCAPDSSRGDHGIPQVFHELCSVFWSCLQAKALLEWHESSRFAGIVEPKLSRSTSAEGNSARETPARRKCIPASTL